MPFVDAAGARIFYTVFGDAGPPVVLLHGMGLSSRCWFELPSRLAGRAAAPYQVVTIDARGTGQSDKPAGFYRMSGLADDVRRVLDDAGIDRAYVAGMSLGGMIAQELALRHPDRVDGLLLISTTPGMPDGALPRPEAIATLLTVPFYDRSKPAIALFRLIFSKKDVPRGEELLEGWEQAIHEDPIDPFGFFGQLTAAMGHSTGSRLRRIRCPTVIMVGDEDVLTPAPASRFLAAQIPSSVLHVMPEMGHGIPMADENAVERGLDEVHAMRVTREERWAPRAEARGSKITGKRCG